MFGQGSRRLQQSSISKTSLIRRWQITRSLIHPCPKFQPDLRVGTQFVTEASSSECSGKRPVDEDDVDLAGNELEQFHYEYKIGT